MHKQTPWPLIRERTISTDRPPLSAVHKCQVAFNCFSHQIQESELALG
jgi:hypothetical protein